MVREQAIRMVSRTKQMLGSIGALRSQRLTLAASSADKDKISTRSRRSAEIDAMQATKVLAEPDEGQDARGIPDLISNGKVSAPWLQLSKGNIA